MGKIWSDSDKEYVFEIGFNYLLTKSVNLNNESIKEILTKFNESSDNKDRDPYSILCQLSGMGLISILNRNTGDFKNKQCVQDDINNYKISPYKEYSDKKKISGILCKSDELIKISEITKDEFFEILMGEFNIPYKKLLTILFKAKRVYYFANSIVVENSLFKVNRNNYISNLIKSKEINKDYINKIRGDISHLYNSFNHPNSLVFSNDGTGFGKSYGVFQEYIEHFDKNDEHRNLFFITPMKSQINIDKTQIKNAKEKNITFLSFLSQGDQRDIEFTDWITGEKNKERYLRWIRSGKSYDPIKKYENSITYTIKNIETSEKALSYCHTFDEKKILEEQILKNKSDLFSCLQKLGIEIINYYCGSNKTEISSLFKNSKNANSKNKKSEILYSEIISFVFPMEYAKYYPTILLSTSQKFDYNIEMVHKKLNNEYTTTPHSFYNIIGKKLELSSDLKISDYLDKGDDDRNKFLDNELFKIDSDNYFQKNDINFTLIVDEEHETYNKFFEKGKIDLMDKDCKIEDVLAASYRVISSYSKDSIFATETEETSEFVGNVTKFYHSNCDISKTMNLIDVLSIFSNNKDGIGVNANQLEQIINITKNVFNFSSKHFFNENSLKNIYIRPHQNNTVCEIYSPIDSSSENLISLFDIFQVVIVLLASLSNLKGTNFHKSLKLREGKNHNFPLYLFIIKASNVKKEIDSIFDRANNEDLQIDRFFTYFQPKTIFTLNKRDDFEYIPASKGVIYVDIFVELRTQLPDVNMLKILTKTQNTVTALSATTGIYKNYTANYNRGFMNEYSESLGFNVIKRNKDDTKNLLKLKEMRAENRSVSISDFKKIDSLPDEINQKFNLWNSKLRKTKNGKSLKSKYKKTEFERVLKSLLIAAYNGENSLILTLSGLPIKIFKEYMSSNFNDKNIEIIDNTDQQIFKFRPFKDEREVVVVLYNAHLDKITDVQSHMRIEKEYKNIVFMSAYKSAGTGLNYFVQYDDGIGDYLDEDFEALYLANSPFYSSILGDNGLNTIDNFLLLLKYYSDGNEIKMMDSFDTNLVNGDNYNILMREHNLEIFKMILQSIGRIERKDTKINTKIYIDKDVIELATLEFVNLDYKSNQTMIDSMSLLNTKFRDKCLEKAKNSSFSEESERLMFEEKTSDGFEIAKRLSGKLLQREAEKYRCSELFKETPLNDIFRDRDTIFNPKETIEKLKEHYKDDPNKIKQVDSLYIERENDISNNIIIGTRKDNRSTLTDIGHSNFLYEPAKMILPSYNRLLSNRGSEFVLDILTPYIDLDDVFSRYIPSRSLLPLLIGNMGEIIIQDILNKVDLKCFDKKEMCEKLGSKAYELFDFYIQIDDCLICIDAKRWSIQFDDVEKSEDTIEKSIKKRETINKLAEKNGEFKKVHFIYANTRNGNNEQNNEQENDSESNIYFLNIFKEVHSYVQGEKKIKTTSSIKINNIFTKLLGIEDLC